jgi:hypothetical protein
MKGERKCLKCDKLRYLKDLCIQHFSKQYPRVWQKIQSKRSHKTCKAPNCLFARKRRGYCTAHLKEFFPEVYSLYREHDNDYFTSRYATDSEYRKRRLSYNSRSENIEARSLYRKTDAGKQVSF